jgi:excisionase family DNA binding protein
MSPVRRLCECGGLRAEATRAALIHIEELACWLATSPRHVRRLVEEQRVPYLKIGHYVRFDPAEISVWINGQRVSMSKERAGDNEPIWVQRSPDGPRRRRLANGPAGSQQLADDTGEPPWLRSRPMGER